MWSPVCDVLAEELKSCPLCDGKAELKTYNLCGDFVSCIRCTECGVSLMLGKVDTKTEAEIKAIAAWNRRVGKVNE